MRKKILFLCTGNSCRSQIAEAFAKKYLEADVYSAGVIKHGLNPLAVAVMGELGIDMSKQESKTLNELMLSLNKTSSTSFDLVVTLCDNAQESCPTFFGAKELRHQGFPDPPNLAKNAQSKEEELDCYRLVRDQIKDYILNLNYNK